MTADLNLQNLCVWIILAMESHSQWQRSERQRSAVLRSKVGNETRKATIMGIEATIMMMISNLSNQYSLNQ